MKLEIINLSRVKWSLIPLLITLVLLAGCSHEANEPEESLLYKRYACRPELAVAQVCGFSLNDSVQVDVVLLQAGDDESWQRLKEEFNIHDEDGTTSWLATADNPAQRTKWNGEPVTRVIASHHKKTVGLYIIESEAQLDALMDYQLEKMK